MTSIIILFFLSVSLSLLLTPLVSGLARKYGLLDEPDERKMHTVPIPRIGGVAIFLSFFLTFAAVLLYPTKIFELLFIDRRFMFFLLGGILAFGLGLWDDIRGLDAKTKLAVQIIIASVAWFGGIHIRIISVFNGSSLDLGLLSLPFTFFWFILLMNAVNLIDGLDGLAAGIVLFVSLALLFISVSTGRHLVAMGFAVLAGSTLGFLRYNFSPASVFMGDSGSYFLGYMLAGMAVMGSLKGSATVAILIPVIALGIPIMDVLIAPIRRFILGHRIFSPDRKHLHHRLVDMGFTKRNAVLLLYAATIGMGILSFLTVHAHDEGIALILCTFGLAVFMTVRKFSHFAYINGSRIRHWFTDISDEMGISTERRHFFSLQLEMHDSQNMRMLWMNICRALDMLGFDMAGLCLENRNLERTLHQTLERLGLEHSGIRADSLLNSCSAPKACRMIWNRGAADEKGIDKEYLFKLELPLIDQNGRRFGRLWLLKDLRRESINQHTLRRVEHLRRTVLGSLELLMETGMR